MSNIVSIRSIRDDTFAVSVDELLNGIVNKEDFVVINGKIEPTRDLALKLFTATKTEKYSVELLQVVSTEKETVYCCRATITRRGKTADGLGACSTLEVDKRGGQIRNHHDALATAETRAYKRALEAVVGLPFINELIVKLFGSYDAPKEKKNIISSDELINKISEAKAIPHLRNIWNKYYESIMSYDKENREKVIRAKEAKKKELEGG